jgi:hypothetical protein
MQVQTFHSSGFHRLATSRKSRRLFSSLLVMGCVALAGATCQTALAQEADTPPAVRDTFSISSAYFENNYANNVDYAQFTIDVRFDLHADQSTQSLEDFIKEKSPKPAADLIAVIGYYLTQIRGAPSFSDGNIEYAYRTLKLKGRPKHLRQIIINQKNTRDWFESADVDGAWKLTRTGQIYVDENLPAKDE